MRGCHKYVAFLSADPPHRSFWRTVGATNRPFESGISKTKPAGAHPIAREIAKKKTSTSNLGRLHNSTQNGVYNSSIWWAFVSFCSRGPPDGGRDWSCDKQMSDYTTDKIWGVHCGHLDYLCISISIDVRSLQRHDTPRGDDWLASGKKHSSPVAVDFTSRAAWLTTETILLLLDGLFPGKNATVYCGLLIGCFRQERCASSVLRYGFDNRPRTQRHLFCWWAFGL